MTPGDPSLMNKGFPVRCPLHTWSSLIYLLLCVQTFDCLRLTVFIEGDPVLRESLLLLPVVINKATHVKTSVPNTTVYYTESNDSQYENEGIEGIHCDNISFMDKSGFKGSLWKMSSKRSGHGPHFTMQSHVTEVSTGGGRNKGVKFPNYF